MLFCIRNILLVSIISLACVDVSAIKFTSSKDGDWNDPATWENNAVPILSDTIIIKNKVSRSQILDLLPGCFFIIENTGVLCCDDTIKINCADSLFNRGNLLCKYFKVAGYAHNEGYMWFREGGWVGYNCGHFHSIGAVNYGTSNTCNSDFPVPEPLSGSGDSATPDTPATDTIPELSLELNFSPNPVSGELSIFLSLPSDDNISLKIFDVRGRLAASLCNGFMASGKYALNYKSEELSLFPGVYFLSLANSERTIVKKLVFFH